ncbi:hypothetical protein [Rummeliibacillus pycnus]|uniref:hypothetical protein n=1 Tax=Rummeliibacillus pycnus TaxID=101070 RepID=UPI000C9BD01B|nr:hypothetical protein [Rummeliibacillus pycnus]
MSNEIEEFLTENKEKVDELIDFAASESVNVSENSIGLNGEKISVVLTEDFELNVFTHPANYWYPVNILYVIATFDCELIIIEFSYVEDFLTDEKLNEFKDFLLEQDDIKQYLSKEFDEEELKELSDDELFNEVKCFLDSECLVLESLKDFDSKLNGQFIQSIMEEVDTFDLAEHAKERMFDDLSNE